MSTSSYEEKIVISDDEIMLVPLGKDDKEPSANQIYSAILALTASHNKLTQDV